MKKTIISLLLCACCVGVNAQEREDIMMLKQQAEKGDLVCMQTLAQHYQFKPQPDFKEAAKWHEMAANKGDTDAMRMLIDLYTWYFKDEVKVNYWLKKASELENGSTGTERTYQLAIRYFDGIGTEPNAVKAIELWKKCAEAGDMNAMFLIGWCHFNGKGVAKDTAKALEWFNQAASYGSGDAMNALAYCAFNGIGQAKNPQQATALYESVLPYNHSFAMKNMAYCKENGLGTAQNKAEAANLYYNAAMNLLPPKSKNMDISFEIGEKTTAQPGFENLWFERAVTLGNKEAAMEVAQRYDKAKQYEKAFKYYQMAANNGNNDALAATGRYYAKGKGVEKDLQRAVQIFRQSGDNLNLGKCYQYGNGVEKDINKAISCYLKAENDDKGEKFYQLGECYAEIGDYTKAFNNYNESSNYRNHDADYKAGQLCEKGQGITKDLSRAADFYSNGLVDGHLSCMRALQRCYTQGIGIAKDPEKAQLLKKAITLILTGQKSKAMDIVNWNLLP